MNDCSTNDDPIVVEDKNASNTIVVDDPLKDGGEQPGDATEQQDI